MSSIKRLASELRADAWSRKVLPALLLGLIFGAAVLVFQISLGIIIFSGPLAPFASDGVRMALFGGFAVCLVVALSGGNPGTVSSSLSAAAMVLGTIGATLAVDGDALLPTMVATVIIGVLATGTCLLLLGRLQLSNLLRFVPYPVAGGYLAGAAAVLCLASLSLMELALDRHLFPSQLEPMKVWNWGPGVAYGVGLWLATKRWKSFFIVPASFVLVAALYHLGLSYFDISREQARAAGLLFAGVTDSGLLPDFEPGVLASVDWVSVAVQIPNILTLVVVTLLCVVVNLSALELAMDCKLDWNREFRAVGWANLVAGAGGGPPGCSDIVGTSLSRKLGADTRLTGIFVALVAGSPLFLGGAALSLLPVPVVGGMLLCIGIGLVDEWLVRSRTHLPWTDYGIVLLIFAVIISFGFLEGIAVGVAVTSVFFALRLARVDVVEDEFTARERRSNRNRPIADRAILEAEGHRVRVYRLRGYIFFGSAHSFVERLERSLSDDTPPACILLDFTAVTGMDFSALNTLRRFVRASHEAGTRVAMGAAPENCRTGLERSLPPAVFADLLFESDADSALERCEDIVIEVCRSDLRPDESSGALLLKRFAGEMESDLDRRIRFEDIAHELHQWLEVRNYAPGEALAAIGAPQNGLQLLLMGRASVLDAEGTRLRQCGPGDVLEVRGGFEAYAATVATVADEPCRTLVMTPAARQRLEESQGPLMLDLYGYLLTTRTAERESAPAWPSPGNQ